LRLEGATIGGDLVCSAGRFLAGPFLLSKPNPEEFDDEDLNAIAANCLRVGSDIIFDENFEAMGAVSLISAHVGNDFSCDAAKFSFPGEEAVVADGMVVEGTTFLTEIETDGVLRFVQANLRQGFYLDGATFDTTGRCNAWTKDQSNAAAIEMGGPSCGIFARHATIGGTFRVEGRKKEIKQRSAQCKPVLAVYCGFERGPYRG
jgi:hypothetical protein